MAVINVPLARRSFEIVLERIAEILKEELSNQAILTNDENLNASVFIERVVRFDHTDLPSVNVAVPRGTFEMHTAIQTYGTYTYRIECYTKASSSEAQDGDALSIIKLHRLMGVCQSILEDARYKTFGYEVNGGTTPFIMNRHFEELMIGDTENFDMESVSKGVLILSVKLPENFPLLIPTLLTEFKTELRLELTDKGYEYLKPVQL